MDNGESLMLNGNSSSCFVHDNKLKKHTYFEIAKRNTFLRIDLDAIWNNIQILQSKCSNHTKMIAVVKGNAYGHGSVSITKYLYTCGLRHFAVATVFEGKELRDNGVLGFIQVLGNCAVEEIKSMIKYSLTPTTCSAEFLKEWSRQTNSFTPNDQNMPTENCVVIKVDTGMSRNGCQCEELSRLMKLCSEKNIKVHSLMTHFAQAWDDSSFTEEQLNIFLNFTLQYRMNGVKVHAANSSAILKSYGTDFDFVRPGIAIYGLPADSSSETATFMQTLGFKPALSWIIKPSLIKTLEKGRKVGYDQVYKIRKTERIATFGIGYADGLSRLLSDKGIITDLKGKEYRIVGRISMDAITVSVDDSVTMDSIFYVIKDDYFSVNSSRKMAEALQTIPYEIGTCLAYRLPRLYVTEKDNFN